MELKTHIEKIKIISIIKEFADDFGVQVYLVGGYVRDLILKRSTKKDFDFLIIGDGPDFASNLAKSLGINEINIYKNFGTAHFVYENLNLEFVGARKESYVINSRNPDVNIGTFEDDIKRRDFTINSIAVSLNKDNFGEIIDKFGGIKDIKNRQIKTILEPFKTFNDDPLRIMRAFRFAAQLNFNIEEITLKAASQMAERLKIVSQERITDEFLKILSSPKPSIGLKLMFYSGVLKIVFPEISNLAGVDQRKDFHHKDVFLHTCKVVDNISKNTGNLWLRFAALVHDIAKPATKMFIENAGWSFHGHEELGARMMKPIFKRMKLPFNKLDYVKKLIRLHLRPIALVDDTVTDSAIRRLIVNAGEDLDDLIVLCRADITSKNPDKIKEYLGNYEKVMKKVIEVKEKDKLREFQSPVRGDVIMKVCGIAPSKIVGQIKSAIEEAILDGKIRNDYDEAFEYLLKIKDKYLNN